MTAVHCEMTTGAYSQHLLLLAMLWPVAAAGEVLFVLTDAVDAWTEVELHVKTLIRLGVLRTTVSSTSNKKWRRKYCKLYNIHYTILHCNNANDICLTEEKYQNRNILSVQSAGMTGSKTQRPHMLTAKYEHTYKHLIMCTIVKCKAWIWGADSIIFISNSNTHTHTPV